MEPKRWKEMNDTFNSDIKENVEVSESIKWTRHKMKENLVDSSYNPKIETIAQLKELYKKKAGDLTKEEKSKILELEKEIQKQWILVARSPSIESTKISMLAKSEPREIFIPDFNNEAQLVEVWFRKWEDGKRYHTNRGWYPNALSKNDVIYIFKRDADG